MIKKLTVQLFVSALLVVPALASAGAAIPTQPTVEQLLTRVAALIALRDSLPVACSVFTSTQKARVGVPYIVWWGSFGAEPDAHPDISQWPSAGATTIIAQKRGVYEYKFSFFGQGQASSTCKAYVTVS